MDKEITSIRNAIGTVAIMLITIGISYAKVSLPFMPSFLNIDFSLLFEILATAAYGPISGLLCLLAKNAVSVLFTDTTYVSEMNNFILDFVYLAVFTVLINQHFMHKKFKHSRKIFAVAGLISSVVYAVVAFFVTVYISYPLFAKRGGYTMQLMLEQYQNVNSGIKNIEQAVLFYNVPAQFIKGIVCALVVALIFRPLRKVLYFKLFSQEELTAATGGTFSNNIVLSDYSGDGDDEDVVDEVPPTVEAPKQPAKENIEVVENNADDKPAEQTETAE